jgi:hypothetical protein
MIERKSEIKIKIKIKRKKMDQNVYRKRTTQVVSDLVRTVICFFQNRIILNIGFHKLFTARIDPRVFFVFRALNRVRV